DGRLGEARARDVRAATERSLDAMIALAAELGVPQAVRRTGSLWVAQDEHERSEIEHALSAAPGSRVPGPGAACACAPAVGVPLGGGRRSDSGTDARPLPDGRLLPAGRRAAARHLGAYAGGGCRGARRSAVRALAGQGPRARG